MKFNEHIINIAIIPELQRSLNLTYTFREFRSKSDNTYLLIDFIKDTAQHKILASFLIYLFALEQDVTKIQAFKKNLRDVMSRRKRRTFADTPYCAVDMRNDFVEVYDCVHEEDSPALAFKSFRIPTNEFHSIISNYESAIRHFNNNQFVQLTDE